MGTNVVSYRATGKCFCSEIGDGAVVQLGLAADGSNDIYGVAGMLESIDGITFPSLFIENSKGEGCPVIPILDSQPGFSFAKIADTVELFMAEDGRQDDRATLLSLYAAVSKDMGVVASDTMAINVISWLERAGYNAEVLQAAFCDSQDGQENVARAREDVRGVVMFVDGFIKRLAQQPGVS